MKKNRFLETELKQRAYDGKWELLARIMDHENSYTYGGENGNVITLVPEKWITIGVYDYLMEIVN